MATGLTYGVGTALSHTWIHAGVVDTRSIVGAFVVALAFATSTMAEWIASVTRQAGTHWTLLSGVIVSGYALSVGAAWIWSTEIFLGEWTTADERIASHVTGTTADRRETSEVAVSANTAGSNAR